VEVGRNLPELYSKDPNGVMLVSRAAWRNFVRKVRADADWS
jgi:hypothetical protein